MLDLDLEIPKDVMERIDSVLFPEERKLENNPVCFATELDYVFADPRIAELRDAYTKTLSEYRSAKSKPKSISDPLKEQAVQLRNMYKMAFRKRRKRYRRVIDAAGGPLANAISLSANMGLEKGEITPESAAVEQSSGSDVEPPSKLPTLAAFVASQGLDKKSLLARKVNKAFPNHYQPFLPYSSNSLIFDWVESSDSDIEHAAKSLATIEKQIEQLKQKLQGAERSNQLSAKALEQSDSRISSNEDIAEKSEVSQGPAELDIDTEKEEGELSESEFLQDKKKHCASSIARLNAVLDSIKADSKKATEEQSAVKVTIQTLHEKAKALETHLTKAQSQKELLDAQIKLTQLQMEQNQRNIKTAIEKERNLVTQIEDLKLNSDKAKTDITTKLSELDELEKRMNIAGKTTNDVEEESEEPAVSENVSDVVSKVHCLLNFGDFWCLSERPSLLTLLSPMLQLSESIEWPEWTDFGLFKTKSNAVLFAAEEKRSVQEIVEMADDEIPATRGDASGRYLERFSGYILLPCTRVRRQLHEAKTHDEFISLLRRYCNNVDPLKPLCPFELSGGNCNDSGCEFQHWAAVLLDYPRFCQYLMQWVPTNDRSLVEMKLQRMQLEGSSEAERITALIEFVEKGALKNAGSLAALEEQMAALESTETPNKVVAGIVALRRASKAVQNQINWRARCFEITQQFRNGYSVPVLLSCLLDVRQTLRDQMDVEAPVYPIDWFVRALFKLSENFRLPQDSSKLDSSVDGCLEVLREGLAHNKTSFELWNVYTELCLRRANSVDEQINLLNEATVYLQAFVPVLWLKLLQFNMIPSTAPASILKLLQKMGIAVTKFKATSGSLGIFNSIWGVCRVLARLESQQVVAIQYIHSLLIAPDEDTIDHVLKFEHEAILLCALENEQWTELHTKPLFRMLGSTEYLLLIYSLAHLVLAGCVLPVSTNNDSFSEFFVHSPPVHVLELLPVSRSVSSKVIASIVRLFESALNALVATNASGPVLLACLLSNIYLSKAAPRPDIGSNLPGLLQLFAEARIVKESPDMLVFALQVSGLEKSQPGTLDECLNSYRHNKSCWTCVLYEQLDAGNFEAAKSTVSQFMDNFSYCVGEETLGGRCRTFLSCVSEPITASDLVMVLVGAVLSAEAGLFFDLIKQFHESLYVTGKVCTLFNAIMMQYLCHVYSSARDVESMQLLLALFMKLLAGGPIPLINRISDSFKASQWFWGSESYSLDAIFTPSVSISSPEIQLYSSMFKSLRNRILQNLKETLPNVTSQPVKNAAFPKTIPHEVLCLEIISRYLVI